MMGAMHALLLALVLMAAAPSEDTRVFEGTGSVGTESQHELYLLEGTYRHFLIGEDDCYVAASVFPSRDELGVPLGDVLSADLAAGSARGNAPIRTSGEVVITEPGWAHLEVGTGAGCAWRYVITGAFVPPGEEPIPPEQRNHWWLAGVAAAGVAALGALGWRRRRQAPPRGEESIRVLDG